MNKTINYILTLSLIATPSALLARSPFENAFGEVIKTRSSASSYSNATLPELIGRVIKSTIGVLGIIALIIIIYSAFKLIFSKGDPESLKKTKNTLFYASLGIIIILLAYSIATIVIKSLVK